jgi:hypothetical protein
MPKGKCPECGAVCYGWALLQPGLHPCRRCGAEMVVYARGQLDKSSAAVMVRADVPDFDTQICGERFLSLG